MSYSSPSETSTTITGGAAPVKIPTTGKAGRTGIRFSVPESAASPVYVKEIASQSGTAPTTSADMLAGFDGIVQAGGTYQSGARDSVDVYVYSASTVAIKPKEIF